MAKEIIRSQAILTASTGKAASPNSFSNMKLRCLVPNRSIVHRTTTRRVCIRPIDQNHKPNDENECSVGGS